MREELKRLRVTNFLTQEQMAKKLGVSRNNYAMIEQGKRTGSVDFWLTLRTKFKLSLAQLEKMREVKK